MDRERVLRSKTGEDTELLGVSSEKSSVVWSVLFRDTGRFSALVGTNQHRTVPKCIMTPEIPWHQIGTHKHWPVLVSADIN